jgi:hypothetical protein
MNREFGEATLSHFLDDLIRVLPNYREKMSIVLHRKALERTLIQMPHALLMSVSLPTPHGRRGLPSHEPPQLTIRLRPQQKASMVGHQAVPQQPQWLGLQRLLQHPLKRRVIPTIGKQLPPLVAPRKAVKDPPRQYLVSLPLSAPKERGRSRHDEAEPRRVAAFPHAVPPGC